MDQTRRTARAAALLLSFALPAAMPSPLSAAALTVGTPGGTGNCLPWGCLAGAAADGRWQQVYAAGSFAGPVEISAARFPLQIDGALDGAVLSVSWHVSATAYLASSSLLADNLGALLGDWGPVSVGGASAGDFVLSGPAFAYDPAEGDLLLDVTVTSLVAAEAGSAFWQAAEGTAETYRNFRAVGGAANVGSALVTAFTLDSVAVPAPAAGPLLLAGLAGAAALRRRG